MFDMYFGSINKLTLLLNIISQCNVKHIMILSINTVMAVLKDLNYIFTSITAHAIKLAVMLELMSVSTFRTEVILYIYFIQIFQIVHTPKKQVF